MSDAPSSPPDLPSPSDLEAMLQAIRTRLRLLTAAIWVMALALVLTAAAVFGSLVNYFAGDSLMFGGVSIGAAMLGFAFGWIARKKG